MKIMSCFVRVVCFAIDSLCNDHNSIFIMFRRILTYHVYTVCVSSCLEIRFLIKKVCENYFKDNVNLFNKNNLCEKLEYYIEFHETSIFFNSYVSWIQ